MCLYPSWNLGKTNKLDYVSGVAFLREKDPFFNRIYNDLGFIEQRKRSVSFSSFVSTIVGQQLSGKAADTIYGRLLDKVDGEVLPEQIITLQIEELREIGISNAKSSYILSLAKQFIDGQILLDDWKLSSDTDLYKNLTSIKGIGPWSAKIIMLFNFERLDAFPYGDVTLEKAFRTIWDRELKELPGFVEKWSPCSGIVAMYMWSFIDTKLD
jgi:DNA-3-methyladenine glycosylase II